MATIKKEIFPELKESDGERIRKAIINVFASHKDYEIFFGVSVEDILAYLEKQGEQKLPIEKLPSEMKSIGESLGFTTQEECDRYNQMVSDLIMSDDKGEQKPAWSEEDEKIRIAIFLFIESYGAHACYEVTQEEMLDWLKSLKGRVLPKQEWSNEDKRKLSRIYSVLRQAADTHAFSTTCRLIGDKECIELQDFLRSIIQQPRQERSEWWKPSDEQMQTLLQCEAVLKVGGQAELGDKLGEIYEQLKNLTE